METNSPQPLTTHSTTPSLRNACEQLNALSYDDWDNDEIYDKGDHTTIHMSQQSVDASTKKHSLAARGSTELVKTIVIVSSSNQLLACSVTISLYMSSTLQ